VCQRPEHSNRLTFSDVTVFQFVTSQRARTVAKLLAKDSAQIACIPNPDLVGDACEAVV
jgi:hypothetical protein